MKRSLLWILVLLVLGGCGGVGSTVFIHPDYDFGYVERVAVLPFENLTDARGAGEQVSRYFLSELLATRAFEVVEPGEVYRAMQAMSLPREAVLTQDQIVELGQELKAQALFIGSVAASTTGRSGGTTVNTVSLVARLVETQKGTTVWSATTSADNRGFWSSLFGTPQESPSAVVQKCVNKCVSTLVK